MRNIQNDPIDIEYQIIEYRDKIFYIVSPNHKSDDNNDIFKSFIQEKVSEKYEKLRQVI
ncbi:MAG TPA: hypothetical protein VGC75_02015 [Candidatus Nitrosocosmicus sp.]